MLGVLCDWLGLDSAGETEFGAAIVFAWVVMWAVLSMVAALLALIGMVRIIASRLVVKGLKEAVVSLIAVALLAILVLPAVKMTRGLGKAWRLNANLRQLHGALRLYAAGFDGRYPTPEKWCDLLIEHAHIPPEILRSPFDKAGPCSYGLNPHADANSPDNMIVLIETDAGWNQHGTRELAGVRESAWILENGGRVHCYYLKRKSAIWEVDPNE